MERQIKVSVIVPVYNVESYLTDCLESVINQTMEEIEIICVDDASKDSSRQILETYAKKDTRIKLVFHDHNMGTLLARKHGVVIATGEYIMFLDSDDEYTIDACETAYNAIEKNQTDIVRFGADVINSPDEGLKKYFRTKRVRPLFGESLLHLWVDGKIRTSWNCWNKIYVTTLCKKAYNDIEDKYFTIAEDVYFSFVYGYFAKSYSEIEDSIYIYRRGVGIYDKLTRGIDLNQFKSILNEKDIFDAIEHFIQRKPDKDKFLPMVWWIYETLLDGNINFWSNKLREADQVKGFELLIKTWLTDNVFCAMKLSDAWRNYYRKKEVGLQKYITARIDIKNFGAEENKVEIIETSDKTAKIQSPAWFKNAQGQGIVVQSSKGEIRLRIKCIGNGALEIALRGMDCRDKNNNRVPIWIDYKKLNVNGVDIFTSSHVVCHDKPFKHRFNVADEEMVTIDAAWWKADD